MSKMTKNALSALAATSLVLGGAAPMVAWADGGEAPATGAGAGEATAVEATTATTAATRVTSAAVTGQFAFAQGETTDNQCLSELFRKASAVLCGATIDQQTVRSASLALGRVAVGGDVNCAFSAALDDERFGDPVKATMGCSCAGDPIDGAAHGNAEVTGASVRAIVDAAAPVAGANTIVFTASDGYEVALPLFYVLQRPSLLVYEVNGADVADVMGGANQLWLGSTSAREFIRDVVEIRIEVRDEAPEAPNLVSAAALSGHTPHISLSEGSSL